MSHFTDCEHLSLIQETEQWLHKEPETEEELLEYAKLQWRLKDTCQAMLCLLELCKQDYGPAWIYITYLKYCEIAIGHCAPADCEQKAICYLSEKDVLSEEERCIFAEFYRKGIGVEKNLVAARKQIEESASRAGYPLWILGKIAEEENHLDEALDYYKESHQLDFEEAIFSHFQLYTKMGGAFQDYLFQREIIEAHSFRLGQYMRASRVAPSKYYFERIANWYEQGFPGDYGEQDIRYKNKGKEFRKKAAQMEQECVNGKLFLFPESEIYRTYIQKKDMSAFDQSAFLSESISVGG